MYQRDCNRLQITNWYMLAVTIIGENLAEDSTNTSVYLVWFGFGLEVHYSMNLSKNPKIVSERCCKTDACIVSY